MTDTLDIKEETRSKQSARSQLLINPSVLLSQHPCPANIEKFISQKRQEISNIIHGNDDRLLVIIGPCSIQNID